MPTEASRVPDDLAAIDAVVADLRRHVVVLDFDGTLSAIVEHPDDARPVNGAAQAIQAVARLTDVVVVSGRPVEDLCQRLPADKVTFVGGHGAAIVTPDGRTASLMDPTALAPVLDEAERLLEKIVDPGDGWLIERKAASIALHHRMVSPTVAARTLPEARDALCELQERRPGWELLDGKAVVELRPVGLDKGAALEHLWGRCGRFAGRAPIVVGDDVTDEDAFRFATSVGGIAVLVARDPRPTLATYRLESPERVVELLRRLAARW